MRAEDVVDNIDIFSETTRKLGEAATSAREREVVETSGTVLLLGRSGTGKTCVICSRMDYDRQQAGADPAFSQLSLPDPRVCVTM